METNDEQKSPMATAEKSESENGEEINKRTSNRSQRSFSHFSLESFRFFSSDFVFLQSYGSKMIESFNSNVNALFSVKVSKRSITCSFWFLYSLTVMRYSVYPAVYLSTQPNSNDLSDYLEAGNVSVSLFFTLFILFEYLTTLRLNGMLQITQYTLNIYALFVTGIFCAADAIIIFNLHPNKFWLINDIGRISTLYPLCYILILLSCEMLQKLYSIMKNCCHDPRLSMTTYLMIMDKETAIKNTEVFYETLCTIHRILEFKLLAAIIFSTWAILNAVYFSSFGPAFVSFLLCTFLIFSSMSQPFYLQKVIKQIEKAIDVALLFSIEVLNIEVSYLWIVLPFLTTILALGKNLWNLHHCSVQN
jgi:hypothetical protein